jgi:hypothetical protein
MTGKEKNAFKKVNLLAVYRLNDLAGNLLLVQSPQHAIPPVGPFL